MFSVIPAHVPKDSSADDLEEPFTFQDAILQVKHGRPIDQAVHSLIAEMTKVERLSLLDGDEKFYTGLNKILCDRYNREPFIMGEIPRLGIPGIRFTDGPRGVVMGSSTAFPVSMSRGATWDVELERRIGDAIGLESKALGANYFAGVCINLPRHPAWGRIQETYSENPLLLGEFGLALTQGVQTHVMACVKHFALNSMENARFRVNVSIEEDVLREVYLPHFKRVIDGGVASVMSSYNSVNNEWAGQSKQLLTGILRNEYKFDGFVLSDFIFGLRNSVQSLKNGLDIEAPFTQQRSLALTEALRSGDLQWSDVNRACYNILLKELSSSISTEASQPDSTVVFSHSHRSLAREAAARSVVLLKNTPVNGRGLLPLDVTKLSRVVVVGRLANRSNTGDKGSSQVFSPHVVTPYAGIKAALPNAEVVLDDTDSAANAGSLASSADLVICIVGYDATDEGEYVVPSLKLDPCLPELLPLAETNEDKKTLSIVQCNISEDAADTGLEVGGGGDRESLRLRPEDVAIIDSVTAANPSTIVSVITAGAVIMEDWKDKTSALLLS